MVVWNVFVYEPSLVPPAVFMIDWSISALILIAMLGFLFKKIILKPLFWKMVFFVTNFVILILGAYLQYTLFELVFTYLLNIPALLAIILYAFVYLPSQVKK